MRESLGLLAHAVPEATPPAGLKARIMALAREGNDPVPVPRMDLPGKSAGRVPIAWMALSAVLCIAVLATAFDAWTSRARYASQNGQLASLTHELELLRGDLDSQRQQIAGLEKENSLSQIRVVTLNPQTPPLGKASAVVVWNAGKQQGLIKGDHLLAPGAGKDYQLWVIEASSPNPVSAGIITVNNDGSFVTSFKPVHPVSTAAKFAISVEASGGSDSPHGPIVFVGG
jgi:anti-sigma-K factor RskA